MTRKNSPWERALAVARVGTPACTDIPFAEPPAAAQDPELESLSNRITRLERLVAQGSRPEPGPQGHAGRPDAA